MHETHAVEDLSNWSPRPAPELPPLDGHFVRIERFSGHRHAGALHAAIGTPADAALWRYLTVGPYADPERFGADFGAFEAQLRCEVYVLLVDGHPQGTVSLMRLRPEHGSAEIGNVVFGEHLKRTPAATEVIYLFARRLFDDLGYRRFEWKCHAGNDASRHAARRFGFRFEGVFRNDMVVKGESRDTAWFAMTDADWPAIRTGFEAWLAPENFDAEGRQRATIETLRARHGGSVAR